MDDSGVPESVEELHERYDKLIVWAIRRTRCVREHEIDEFRQQVYLRVLERDFLARCRAYYATHPGRFSSSLTVLVRNEVYRRAEKIKSDPMAGAVGFASEYEPVVTSWERLGGPWATQPKTPLVPSHERAVEARDILAQIGRRLTSPKRHTQITDVLDTAVEHGLHSGHLAQVLGTNPSTIRYYLVTIRAEARRLEQSCTATTKFARKSARRGSASRSSSGRETDSPTASV